jgi:hypothetical protein
MLVEINIDDYLSEHEKKQICLDYFRGLISGADTSSRERILSNLAYSAAFAIYDEALDEEMKTTIRNKVASIIKDESHFGVFRKKDAWGQEESEAYLEVKKAVAEHKHLINDLVKKAIIERDYFKDIDDHSSYIGDVVVQALRDGLTRSN